MQIYFHPMDKRFIFPNGTLAWRCTSIGGWWCFFVAFESDSNSSAFATDQLLTFIYQHSKFESKNALLPVRSSIWGNTLGKARPIQFHLSFTSVFFAPVPRPLIHSLTDEQWNSSWLLTSVSIRVYTLFCFFFFLSIVLADSVCDCAIRMTHGIVAGSSHLFEGHTFKHGAGKWCLICVFATVYRRGKWLARNSTQRTNKTWSIRRLLPGKIPSNLVWLVFFVKYHASPSIITMRLHLEIIFEQLPLKCLAIQKSFYFTLATHRACSLQHKNNLHNFQKQLSPTQRK